MTTRLDYRTKQFRRLACASVHQLLSSDQQHLQDLEIPLLTSAKPSPTFQAIRP